MRIVRLEASNFQRLHAVDITPKGHVVQITGKNANGKTSVLDAISAAIQGAAHIHVKPIRNGATKAHIKLDLGEVIVTRSITEKGSTLTVENAEGMAYKSPQRMLDDLVGALSFDPLAFTRMKPKEQFDQVKAIAKLDVDVEALDNQNRQEFERRTTVNRDLKGMQAQLDALPAPGDAPEAVDITALLERQQELISHQNKSLLAAQQRQGKERQAEALRRELEGIRLTFADKKAALEALEQDLAGLSGDIDTDTVTRQIQEINAEIRNAQQTNEAASEARRAADRRAELKAKTVDLDNLSQSLTETMEVRTKVKQEAIARAKMPVAGLGFGDGMVLYNGVPFEQASSAEQLRVSVAIAIAGNPKLRVIRIQDGSLLDDTSMELLAEMARENDMQVWIERVQSGGKVGVVIEDGAVAGDYQEAEQAPDRDAVIEAVSLMEESLRRKKQPTTPTLDLE